DPLSAFNNEPASIRGERIDLGAYGNTAEASAPRSSYIVVDAPNFYTDWVRDSGHVIKWHTHNVSGNVTIKVQEVNVTPAPPAILIDTVPASPGEYTWTPANSGLPADSAKRYKIIITSVDDTSVTASSREPFAVPSAGNVYYVNDNSQTGDEYTSAVGNNRNTGKTAADPKANLLPMLTNYDLGPSAVVKIDTGNYLHVRDVLLTGDMKRGDDAGATYTGPVHHELGHNAVIDRANKFGNTKVIDVDNGSAVALEHLTFTGAVIGLLVHS